MATGKKPSAAQLRARANFTKMVKERAQLRAAGKLPPVKRKAKAAKVKRKTGKPSPAQLAARAKFAAMVRAKAGRKNRRNVAGGDSSVRSPTSSDVRSPTRTATSTEAQTSGNVTVTGGAGRGATTRVSIHTQAPRAKKETVGAKKTKKNSRGFSSAAPSWITKRTKVKKFAKARKVGSRIKGFFGTKTKTKGRGSATGFGSGFLSRNPKKKTVRKKKAYRPTLGGVPLKIPLWERIYRATSKKNPGIIKMSEAEFAKFGKKIKGAVLSVPARTRSASVAPRRKKPRTFKKKGIFGGSGFLGLGRSVQKISRNPVVRTTKTACSNCKAKRVLMNGKVTVCADCGMRRNPRFRIPRHVDLRRTGTGARAGRKIAQRGLKIGYKGGGGRYQGPVRFGVHSTQASRLPNPAPAKVFTEFRGKSVTCKTKVKAATGTPSTLAQLGRLRELKLRGKTLRFKAGHLAADGRKKLYIVGIKAKQRGNPGGEVDYGEIISVTYEADKPSVEPGTFNYVHKFGEEGGVRPHLIVDPEGYMLIEGGSYGITADGIID